MERTTHADEKGVSSRNTSVDSKRMPSEIKDKMMLTDDKAQEAGDDKLTSTSAADEEDDGDIVYPEGMTFIFIMASLLLCVFLMALDQVCRLILAVVATSTFLIQERPSWPQLFQRSRTSFIASMMCHGMARLILSPSAAFRQRGGKPINTFPSSTPFSSPLEFSNSEV